MACIKSPRDIRLIRYNPFLALLFQQYDTFWHVRHNPLRSCLSPSFLLRKGSTLRYAVASKKKFWLQFCTYTVFALPPSFPLNSVINPSRVWMCRLSQVVFWDLGWFPCFRWDGKAVFGVYHWKAFKLFWEGTFNLTNERDAFRWRLMIRREEKTHQNSCI